MFKFQKKEVCAMPAIHLTKENFDAEVLSSNVPVLVDFWASWCGPCKMVGPVIEELSEEFSGKAKVCKIDIDKEGELAMRYNVMSIPTILVFKNGEIADQSVGAYPKDHFSDMLTKQL